MENDRSDRLEGTRLPGSDVHMAGRPGYGWPPQPYWQPAYPPPYGARHTRRVSNWTAAALIAGVAATTGYLAHAIPSTSGKSTALSHHHKARRSAGYVPAAPAYVPPPVQAPVVTSGGSGGHGGGGD
jgi:hypothetical protein